MAKLQQAEWIFIFAQYWALSEWHFMPFIPPSNWPSPLRQANGYPAEDAGWEAPLCARAFFGLEVNCPKPSVGISPGGCLRADCASRGGSWYPAISALWMEVPVRMWVTHIPWGQRWQPLLGTSSAGGSAFAHPPGMAGGQGTGKLIYWLNPPGAAVPLPVKQQWLNRLLALWFNGWLLLQCLGTLWQGAVKGQRGTNSRCVFQQPQPEIVLYIADKQSTSAPCLCLHFIELSPLKQRNPSWLNSTFIIWILPVSFPVSMVP